MNIKVTVDYVNGCYNVTGLYHGEILTICKPIRGVDKDMLYKESYKPDVIKKRRRDIKRASRLLKRRNRSLKFTEKSLKNVDELMFKALEDWDNMCRTDYALQYLEIAGREIEKKRAPGMSRSRFERECRRVRRNELKHTGIDISYNVSLFNTSRSMTFLDRIKGMTLARKQQKVLGVKVYSSLVLGKGRYIDDPMIFKEAMEQSDPLTQLRRGVTEIEDPDIEDPEIEQAPESVSDLVQESGTDPVQESVSEVDQESTSDTVLEDEIVGPSIDSPDFFMENKDTINNNRVQLSYLDYGIPEEILTGKVVDLGPDEFRVIESSDVPEEQATEETPEKSSSKSTKNITGGTRRRAIERYRKQQEQRQKRMEREAQGEDKESKTKRTVKNSATTRENLTKKQREQLKKKEARSETPQERNLRLTQAKRENQRKIREAHERKVQEEERIREITASIQRNLEAQERAIREEVEAERRTAEPEVIEAEAEEPKAKNKRSLRLALKNKLNKTRFGRRINAEVRHWTRKIRSAKESIRNFKFKPNPKYRKIFIKGAVTAIALVSVLSLAHTINNRVDNVLPNNYTQVETQVQETEHENSEHEVVIQGETSKPAGGNEQSTNTQKPAGGNEQSTNTQKPAEETEQSGNTQKPAEETEQSGNTQKPAEETEQSGNTQKPAEEIEQSGNTQKPAEETEQSGNTQKPSGGNGQSSNTQSNNASEEKPGNTEQESSKTEAEIIEEFRQNAIKKYMDSFSIGSKPSIGDMFSDKKYYENPDGTGKFGYFSTHPDYAVGFINIISDKGWTTVRLEGKTLSQLLEEHPECTGYNIHFVNSKTGGGLGFVTKDQLESMINSKIDSVIDQVLQTAKNNQQNINEDDLVL